MKRALETVLIAALTRRLVIGQRGKMPWQLPEELRLFRTLTWGHSLIMGRKTFAAIGRPLAGRRNIVLSTSLAPRPDLLVCRSLEEALAAAAPGMTRCFIIGGAQVYRQALPLAETMYLSWVRGDFAGDTYFPAFDPRPWQVTAATEHPGFRHVVYRRRS